MATIALQKTVRGYRKGKKVGNNGLGGGDHFKSEYQ